MSHWLECSKNRRSVYTKCYQCISWDSIQKNKILIFWRIWQSRTYYSILIGLFIGQIRGCFQAHKMVLVKNGMSSSSSSYDIGMVLPDSESFQSSF